MSPARFFLSSYHRRSPRESPCRCQGTSARDGSRNGQARDYSLLPALEGEQPLLLPPANPKPITGSQSTATATLQGDRGKVFPQLASSQPQVSPPLAFPSPVPSSRRHREPRPAESISGHRSPTPEAPSTMEICCQLKF